MPGKGKRPLFGSKKPKEAIQRKEEKEEGEGGYQQKTHVNEQDEQEKQMMVVKQNQNGETDMAQALELSQPQQNPSHLISNADAGSIPW